jgi:tetratricopeptide (TPR) repeat protein
MIEEMRAQNRQGIALVQGGRLDEAAALFKNILSQLDAAVVPVQDLRRQTLYANAYNNLANVFLFQGRYDEAVAHYRLALNVSPNDPSLYNHLSYAYSKKGDGMEAEAWARHALSLRPIYPEAQNHLGIALGLQGKYPEAEACYWEALRLMPTFPKAYANLAQLCYLERRQDDAIEMANNALAQDANQAEPHATLAAVFIRQRKWEQALSECRQALQLNPHLPEALFNLASCHLEMGQFAEATQVCQDALRINPDHIDIEQIVGLIALKESRLDDALSSFDKVLRKKPNEALVHFNRAVTWIMQGNYEQGWPEYEWRWKCKEFDLKPFTKQPIWNGSSLAGKTILLGAEQGLGDTLQFIRYAPLVKQQAAKVVVACHPSMLRLLSRCAGFDRLVSHLEFTGTFDEHAPLMSLPGLLKTTVATIPATVPYIFPDPTLVEKWRDEWAATKGLKVGLAWQGNPTQADDRFRSIPLREFAPLEKVDGIQWFSLQKEFGREQLATAPIAITDLSARLEDFADTAAVLMNLDLFITSDSAIAHLAGALGVRVWLALQFSPDCRWFLDREDCPWYPTMRLFRQNKRGDWQGVFERIAGALSSITK